MERFCRPIYSQHHLLDCALYDISLEDHNSRQVSSTVRQKFPEEVEVKNGKQHVKEVGKRKERQKKMRMTRDAATGSALVVGRVYGNGKPSDNGLLHGATPSRQNPVVAGVVAGSA